MCFMLFSLHVRDRKFKNCHFPPSRGYSWNKTEVKVKKKKINLQLTVGKAGGISWKNQIDIYILLCLK